MGKIEKRDLIIAFGFGLVMGIVNLFSHKVLEIDFRSEELLQLELKDFKWFIVGVFFGTACYLALYLINSRCDFRKTKGSISERKCFLLTFALTMISWSMQLLSDNPCFVMGDTTFIIEYGMSMAIQHPFLYVFFLAGGYSFLQDLPAVFPGDCCF